MLLFAPHDAGVFCFQAGLASLTNKYQGKDDFDSSPKEKEQREPLLLSKSGNDLPTPEEVTDSHRIDRCPAKEAVENLA